MSSIYVIEGGHPLRGEVVCGGAKNSALKLLATTLLAPGESTLRRVPEILDVRHMIDVLRHLGAEVDWTDGHEVRIDVPQELGHEAPYELVSRMRASTAVLGPLIARNGRARVALPGGCNLGPRRIDLHLRGLEQLGAELHVSHGYIEAACSELRGAVVALEYPSVGATENLMMAGVLAHGRTVIENAAREPELVDLAMFLRSMGARIEGAGTAQIEIEGVDELRPATHDVMADRLDAGTFLFAAAATAGDVTVRDMEPSHLEIVLAKLAEAGAEVTTDGNAVRLVGPDRPKPVDVSTLPFPGFPTDLQPLIVALLARADGLSIITENIFDGRYMFIDELARMGADVRVEGHYAVIRGVRELEGAPVQAPDLRAGAALVLAGLVAQGRTVVGGLDHIERGYENLDERLRALGASIERQASDALLRA
jgi:UDP-N-acetylglucosamine 1-carboxyvinyltransferase